MEKIYRQIIFTETIQRRQNELITVNLWKMIKNFPMVTSQILLEIQSNPMLRKEIFSKLINKENSQGNSAFLTVCKNSQIELFDSFKNFDPNINFSDPKDNFSCLFHAILSGNDYIVTECIKIYENTPNFTSDIFKNPLVFACKLKNTNIALKFVNVFFYFMKIKENNESKFSRKSSCIINLLSKWTL